MAVYTHLGAEEMAQLLKQFDVGRLLSAKGIAEGVENSNYLVETTVGRFILTIYEKRVAPSDLPFFLGLLDHLSAKGSPVPATMHTREGALWTQHGGKHLALIAFMPGLSVSQPTAAQAHAVGVELARMHLRSADFRMARGNELGLAGWQRLAAQCGDGLDSINPALAAQVVDALARLGSAWPTDLPAGIIHADLFPDNVLMDGDRVASLIDFYFACNDALAYDLAITHAAWCFDANGADFAPEVSKALIAGYNSERQLSPAERTALPILAQGAALRFTLTRAYDWINTPADALVTRKDPLAFARRLAFYSDQNNDGIWK